MTACAVGEWVALPTGAAPLASPSATSPRLPLEEFVQNSVLLAALRKGVRAMKQRKASDPLSWFYQAAIHGVTDDAIADAVKDDPGVVNVFKKRYWNQCPHDGENSANFLPWHRGYTHYFEDILRMHTEEPSFSLPYWNYTEKANRKFPREYGIQHLDGNLSNETPDNINPLFHPQRDFYFTGYEHPFATGLPLLALSDDAVDISLPINSPVFFGETEREGLGGGIADEDPSTRGLLESYPHDQIHRAVGGILISPKGEEIAGAMATPPTAGFDPIFSVHHSNIDRLWAQWACMPGKKWGKLPSAYWFNERPWFFFDTQGRVVNEPRKTYFDYRALGIRFKYEDANCEPLKLPVMGPSSALEAGGGIVSLQSLQTMPTRVTALGAVRSIVPLPAAITQHFRTLAPSIRGALDAARPFKRISLRLVDVNLGGLTEAGFDLHVTHAPQAPLHRNDPSFVGSIGLFVHADHHESAGRPETFDISKAIAAIPPDALAKASLVLAPYSLLQGAAGPALSVAPRAVSIGSLELLTSQ